MKSFFIRIIFLLFPERCVVCKKESISLCKTCLQTFPLAPYQEDSWVHSLFSYKDRGVRNTIHALKFKHTRSIADYFSPLIHEMIQEIEANKITLKENEKIILLPVPKMLAHVRTRGFDAMWYLCTKIKEQDKTRYIISNDSIIRINTKAQTGLTRKERLTNMHNSFKLVHKDMFHNQNVYIIDDVTTTGSTLRELQKICLSSGAKKVQAVTIAH